MSPHFALIVFGLASVCLLLRARAQMTKPRAFVAAADHHIGPTLRRDSAGSADGVAVARSMPSDLLTVRRRPGTLGRRRGGSVQRGREGHPHNSDDGPTTAHGLRTFSGRTVALRVPSWMRHRVRRDTIRVKVVHLVIGLLVLLLAPSIGPALLLCALGIGRARKRRMFEQQRARRSAALPDLVDMIRLCVASGCTPYGAIEVLGSLPLRADDVLAPLINEAARELERGAVVSEVLDRFQAEVGEAARPLCSALRSSADLGTPIAETLDLLAREARRARKAQADVAAKRLPVLLLFPLITCILPAFALLAIVPLLGGALSALHW
jgi:tight adherence protein C